MNFDKPSGWTEVDGLDGVHWTYQWNGFFTIDGKPIPIPEFEKISERE